MLRHVKKQSWETIAGQLFNLSGDHPSWTSVRETVQNFSVSKCCRKTAYAHKDALWLELRKLQRPHDSLLLSTRIPYTSAPSLP